jgi:hypothetical protein
MSDNHDLHDERISKLYRMGSRAEPPKHLDEQITRAAHAASPARKHRLYWPSLATAAVLVLSISLVLKVLNQTPLEESLMESLPSDDGSSPALMLEKELKQPASPPAAALEDQDSGKQDEPGQDREATPERYRDKRQSSAPIPAAPQTDSMGASQLKPAPAKVERVDEAKRRSLKHKAVPSAKTQTPESAVGKAQVTKLDCSAVPLPESASIEVWRQQYQTALKQGQSKSAECLKQGFYRRFGQPMPQLEPPEHPEPGVAP